jgi:hypothetical protein
VGILKVGSLKVGSLKVGMDVHLGTVVVVVGAIVEP